MKQPFGSSRLVVLIPYLWLIAFFLVPFVIVAKISLSQTVMALPPYRPLLDLTAGWAGLKDFAAHLTLDAYALLGSDDIYLHSYLKSLEVAAVSTALLLLIGYPLAYGIARSPRGLQPLLVMLVVLPFWTSFLIRVYAWINILQRDGLLNDVLMRLHLIDAPRAWLASDTAIYIGVVYSYLPFMVLPLYAALEKIDASLLEAAADLGCPRARVLAGDAAVVVAGHRRRRAALLHPDHRRVCHSRSARRLAHLDDRADPVD
jgi:putrescine transport system permease protein